MSHFTYYYLCPFFFGQRIRGNSDPKPVLFFLISNLWRV
jgi:hypothetical protein